MLCNISIGYAIAQKNRMMASTKKRIPSAFYRLGLLYIFLNFPNIKHIAYILQQEYNLPGWQENKPQEKLPPLAI